MGLPAGCLHDRSYGRALRAMEQFDHPGLLRDGLARFAGSLRSLVSGLLTTCSNRPARKLVGCEIGPLLGAAGGLGFRPRAELVDLNGCKATLGDAQRKWSFVVVIAPDWKRATRFDLFDQSVGQELADHLAGSAALQVGYQFNRAILTL